MLADCRVFLIHSVRMKTLNFLIHSVRMKTLKEQEKGPRGRIEERFAQCGDIQNQTRVGATGVTTRGEERADEGVELVRWL